MIHIESVVKKFGDRTAVDGVTLAISQGEIFGLLGPNGAGKTTIIRMLTMLTRPTAGRLEINGWQVPADERQIKDIIGIVPQHINLDPDLTVRENLDLHGRLHHIPVAERQARIAELLDYVELGDRGKDAIHSLSGGMKRRLMIARALLHRPRILFLDEPTVGLDPQVRRRLWDLIRRLNGDNLTVLLTTHYIEEAEALCGQVAILDKGKLIALDSPADLCRRAGDYVVEWVIDDGRQTRFFHSRGEAAEFAGQLTMTTTIRRSNLEDVFVELTGRKVNE
ncbi:MAG TPA: ABC transporter ATP-binding protein [Negativicutes bacterium]|nr:ABC transporter ATP-binding protein [Negativicutes bacterium]